jgi:hypothetical protein
MKNAATTATKTNTDFLSPTAIPALGTVAMMTPVTT